MQCYRPDSIIPCTTTARSKRLLFCSSSASSLRGSLLRQRRKRSSGEDSEMKRSRREMQRQRAQTNGETNDFRTIRRERERKFRIEFIPDGRQIMLIEEGDLYLISIRLYSFFFFFSQRRNTAKTARARRGDRKRVYYNSFRSRSVVAAYTLEITRFPRILYLLSNLL